MCLEADGHHRQGWVAKRPSTGPSQSTAQTGHEPPVGSLHQLTPYQSLAMLPPQPLRLRCGVRVFGLRLRRQMSFRGSRKHVLDWVEEPKFTAQFEAMLSPSGARPVIGTWRPLGYSSPDEAKLDSYGPNVLPNAIDWGAFADWWLVHKRAANTPNWDLVAKCDFSGRPGLALVEAKANVSELKSDGKLLPKDATVHTIENHKQIESAINEARVGLSTLMPGVTVGIRIEKFYQLANRLTFAWKLASLGVPVVLVYLGFLQDHGINDAGPELQSDQHWNTVFWDHASTVVPRELFERQHVIGGAPLWLFLRSRVVLSPSRPIGTWDTRRS
jgi:hypothetical protein